MPDRQKSLEEETQKLIESHRLKQNTEQNQPSTVVDATVTTPTATLNRKSVSFDLSDNEYIPVFNDDEPPKSEPTQPENLAELFLRQFSQESEGDGYEVPIKYPVKGRAQRTPKPVKSILRSPSPNASIPLSSDRPLRTTHVPSANQTVIAAIVHSSRSSDEEIERENPFRKEFQHGPPYENIYEEITSSDSKPTEASKRLSSDSDSNDPASSRYATPKKVRPKSAYDAVESGAYAEIKPKASHSNENLLQAVEADETLPKRPAYKSTGSLIDRPKQKPPLPPKPVVTPLPPKISPTASQEQPSSNVKHADVVQNEALKIFQSEMEHGAFYEFLHDATSNRVTQLKQMATPVSELTPKESNETNRPTTFSQENPLPSTPTTPHYTKVNKRHGSNSERPPTSPPPPPINLATLPSADKLRRIETSEVGSVVEILTKRRDSHHENSPEYNLVTQATHREILLHENELRNAIQQEQVVVTETATTNRNPIRRAPAPPAASTASTTTLTTVAATTSSTPQHTEQQQPQQQQIFPQTQILPVQYSHLPTPQQPDYFHAFPPTPINVCCPPPAPNASGAGYSIVVSDTNRVPHHQTNTGYFLESSGIPDRQPEFPYSNRNARVVSQQHHPYHHSHHHHLTQYHHQPMPTGSYLVQSSAAPIPAQQSSLVAPALVQFYYNNNTPNQNQPNYLNLPSWATPGATPYTFSDQQRSQQQQDIHHQTHSFDHYANRHFEQIISKASTTNIIDASSPSSPPPMATHIYEEPYEPSYANDGNESVPMLPGRNRQTPTATLADNENRTTTTLTTFGKQTSV